MNANTYILSLIDMVIIRNILVMDGSFTGHDNLYILVYDNIQHNKINK